MSSQKRVYRSKKKAAPRKITRRPRKFTGYGAYKPVNNDTSKDAYARGKAAGLRSKKRSNEGGIGSKIGSAIGSGLGAGAEHFVRWLTGFGDYEVKENVLLTQDPPPMINESNKGGTLIRHREYLQDVITSPTTGAFKLDSYLINAANEKTFPFLHQCAMNYEQYSLEGMIFEFRSMSADALNSTNTALGSVVMATNYDALDANFKQKSEMENYEFGNSCKPSVNMMHPIECAPRQTTLTELYTLNGAAPPGADLRFYHWGNFQLATVGFQAASVNIGELWVTYQVRLLKPKLFTALGLEIGDAVISNSTYTNLLPLGSGTQTYVNDTIGVAIDAPNRNIGFPISGVRKHYLVTVKWTGGLVAVTYPAITYTNCTPSAFQTSFAPAGGESCTAMEWNRSIIVDANAFGVVTFSTGGVLPTAGNSCLIYIMEVNPFNY